MTAPKIKNVLQHRLHLNLLYPQGVPQRIYVRFIKWLLSYGRFIVIAVELVVIAAFVARFKLDGDLSDLNQKINNQIPFINSLVSDELLIRRGQAKLAHIKTTFEQTPLWTNLLKNISSEVPSNIILNTLNVEKNTAGAWQFRMSGESTSNNDLALMLSGLKRNPAILNPSLAALSFEKGTMIFNIIGTIQVASGSAQGGSL